MKRSFPPAREGLLVLLAALAANLGCEPDNSVKSGAPELTQIVIVQGGGAFVAVTPDTPDCTSGIAAGDACSPAADPPDTLCRDVAGKTWCTCNADAMDMMKGAWACDPLSNVLGVVAIFDRLIDTTDLDPAPMSDFANVMAEPASAPPFSTTTDYTSNGTPKGLIPLLGDFVFGHHLARGPNLFTSAAPAFPSGASITISLDATKVRAKDGHTGFVGAGALQDGSVAFTTAAFAANIATPDPAKPDMTPATVSFTNFVDPATIVDHVHVTVNNAPFTAVTVTSDGTSATVTPTTAWPASATVVITVDATAKNVLDQSVAAATTAMFMTAAM